MRFRTTLIAAAALAAGVALADPPQSSSQGQHQAYLDRLTTELNLNPDQKDKVEKVLEQQRTKMQSMRDQASSSGQKPSREEMRSRRDAMDQEMTDQLKPILTDEQMTKFKQLQQERHSHAQGYRQGGRPEGQPQPQTQL